MIATMSLFLDGYRTGKAHFMQWNDHRFCLFLMNYSKSTYIYLHFHLSSTEMRCHSTFIMPHNVELFDRYYELDLSERSANALIQ